MSDLPILYSFRRCPYAMRARFALAYSGITCYLREVDLKHKPSVMLEASPKGTVPVLCLPDGRVIEESLDIIYYALGKNDPEGWSDLAENNREDVGKLVAKNDQEFTVFLRKYKYYERYPEAPQQIYRQAIEENFLNDVEMRLRQTPYLVGDKISVADIAIFPFMRQFAYVDETWFFCSQYRHTINWLQGFLENPLFETIMKKHIPWQEGQAEVVFP